jgi:hypothetical protein
MPSRTEPLRKQWEEVLWNTSWCSCTWVVSCPWSVLSFLWREKSEMLWYAPFWNSILLGSCFFFFKARPAHYGTYIMSLTILLNMIVYLLLNTLFMTWTSSTRTPSTHKILPTTDLSRPIPNEILYSYIDPQTRFFVFPNALSHESIGYTNWVKFSWNFRDWTFQLHRPKALAPSCRLSLSGCDVRSLRPDYCDSPLKDLSGSIPL